MLKYFPTPYPGETVYSLLARYITTYGISVSVLKQQLKINNEYISINPIIGMQLDKLFNILPCFYPYNEHDFLNEHTIIPVYKAFLYKDEYEKLKTNVIANLNGAMRNITKTWKREIKYCSKCIEEDRKKYKEAYLHREHQSKGILFCHKHLCELGSIIIEKDELININNIECIKHNNMLHKMTNKEKQVGLKVAKCFNDLLINNQIIDNYTDNRIDLFAGLRQNMKFFYQGKFNWQEISKVLFETCSLELLNNIWGNKLSRSKDEFINMLSRKRQIKDPIVGLWLMNILLNKEVDFIYGHQNGVAYEALNFTRYREYFRKEVLRIKEREPNITKIKLKEQVWQAYYWLSRNDSSWLEEQLNIDERRMDQIEELTKKHVKKIQDFIQNNKTANRSEIKLKNNQSYAWLRKYKSDILESILPPSKGAIKDKEKLFDKHSKIVYEVLDKNPKANLALFKKKYPGTYQWFKRNNGLWLDTMIEEHQIKYYYKSILEIIGESHMTIFKLKKKRGKAYKWLQINDSKWLEEIISKYKLS